MRFTKKQLDFIDVFVSCMDSKSQLGKKLHIKVNNGEATFTQFSTNIKLFKKINIISNEDFEIVISTSIFNNFLKTISNDDEIILTKDEIKIGENCKYTFELFSIEFPDVNEFFNCFEKGSDNVINFIDLKKLSIVKSYIGKDDMEIIGFMDNSFVGSDRITIAIVNTKNTSNKIGEDNIFYIPKEVGILFEKSKEDQIKCIEMPDKNFWYFLYNDIYCVIEYKKYYLPYIFMDKIRAKYDHKYKIIFNAFDFVSSLKRMNIFTADNPNSRVYLTFNKDNFCLENRDFNKSIERIEYDKCDFELFGKTIIVSCNNLLKAISSLEGKKINIYVSNNDENQYAIKIEDEIGSIKIIIRIEQLVE